MAGVNPVLVLVLPLAYILASTMITLKLTLVLSLLGQAGVKVRSMKQLAPIEPAVTALVDYLTRVFGPLHKFTPQPTHVLLVAVIVALVVHGSGSSRRKVFESFEGHRHESRFCLAWPAHEFHAKYTFWTQINQYSVSTVL
ncbi:hypothetical protein VOLCADRAFT_106349 [Volvox carteri f. nagariensis]|uniref:Uncharacterized protein n=1 Tax=Volvox carteri f. nagariensis TaxID=3068 RepID=D8U6R2_VOLCA|nr:uncharacterized protein VOLCADRAFT_106349 [Volvox carteri f. nagariensis]EFJ44554.1 hypothetical protein VOLCADRAFT_106349 [Volvox carteri f. nagariensis]|eukprot:XP_002954404.1 hypothetical protein VOLCADRAFT_106349 [Volvox carteri f. nagariensis]